LDVSLFSAFKIPKGAPMGVLTTMNNHITKVTGKYEEGCFNVSAKERFYQAGFAPDCKTTSFRLVSREDTI
jgi:hypothetical protein